jgi:hypothetical protein
MKGGIEKKIVATSLARKRRRGSRASRGIAAASWHQHRVAA